jgi:hypothetical protein
MARSAFARAKQAAYRKTPAREAANQKYNNSAKGKTARERFAAMKGKWRSALVAGY